MPKRSIEAYAPKWIRLGHRFYSDDDIEAIIAAAGGLPDGEVDHEIPIDDAEGFRHETRLVPRRQALRERLERAAHAYAVFSKSQTNPTAKQVTDAMADIEAAAAKLIRALHLPEAMDQDPLASMPAALRYGALEVERALPGCGWPGPGSLRDSVCGVYLLLRWAQNVRVRIRATLKTQPSKRHASDEELDHLFEDLAAIWTEIFKCRIATSVGGPLSPNARQAGGPMVRFFSACLKPLFETIAKESVAPDRHEPTQADILKGEAIRNRIRRMVKSNSIRS